MSERCPCGSRLKLKECCVSEDIAAIKRRFVGDCVFPERMDWAAGYLEYKTINNQQIAIEQRDYVNSIGKEITCQKRCSKCCLEFIAARLEECDGIAVYLYFYPDIMNTFLKNYDAWHRRVTAGGNILQKISVAHQKTFDTRAVEDKKIFEDLALEYARQYACCPFLKNDECIIYPVRPYTCSVYSVISDRKYCSPDFPQEVYVQNKLKLRSAVNPLYFDTDYYVDLEGRMIFGPMQSMVHHLIKHGPPSPDSDGLEELYRTA